MSYITITFRNNVLVVASYGMKHTTSGWGASIALLSTLGSATHDDGDTVTLHTPHSTTWFTDVLYVKEQGLTHTPHLNPWVSHYRRTHPHSSHITVGFARKPDTSTTLDIAEAALSSSALMSTTMPPRLRPLPQGHTVRPLTVKTWRDHLESRDASLYAHTPRRSTLQAAVRQASDNSLTTMVAEPSILWLGVYCGKRVAAEAAVHIHDDTAYIFRVATEHNNRRCGLATHALASTALWALEQGAARWLIFAEAESPLGRIASRLGFTQAQPSWHLSLHDEPAHGHRSVDLTQATPAHDAARSELPYP